MATAPERRDGESSQTEREQGFGTMDDRNSGEGDERICKTENERICKAEDEKNGETEDKKNCKIKEAKNLGNENPSVIVEDTSAHAVRTPSKVGNKDFEVLSAMDTKSFVLISYHTKSLC